MTQDERQDTGRGNPDERFLLEAELADRWRISVRTLQRWRKEGMALDHLVIRRRVLYRRTDVEAFEASSLRPGSVRP